DVFDPDGDLSAVRIYGDGKLLARAGPGPGPFTTLFKTPELGSHRVSVEADDQSGHLTRMESLFTIVSNLVPVVEMIAPFGQTFPAGNSVMLEADASDPDGSIQQVTFFV